MPGRVYCYHQQNTRHTPARAPGRQATRAHPASYAQPGLFRLPVDEQVDGLLAQLADRLGDGGQRRGAQSRFGDVVRVLRGRDGAFRQLRSRGVGAGAHYPPNHLQPAFTPWHRNLPVTESLGQQILSLPFHPGMNDEDVHHVVSALEQALRSTASEIS